MKSFLALSLKKSLLIFGSLGLLSIALAAVPAISSAAANGSSGAMRVQPSATGTIAAINGNTITLTGTNAATYTVDASSVQLMVSKTGVSPANSGLEVGDMISVFGAVSGTNVTATKIIDGSFPKPFMGGKGPLGMTRFHHGILGHLAPQVKPAQ